jgi:hypothetical protein
MLDYQLSVTDFKYMHLVTEVDEKWHFIILFGKGKNSLTQNK